MRWWRNCIFLTRYRVHRPYPGKQFLEVSRLKVFSGDGTAGCDTSFSAFSSSNGSVVSGARGFFDQVEEQTSA